MLYLQAMGRGQGVGQGHGQGEGEGSGGVNENSVVAGGVCASGLTIFMVVCGLPMFFSGMSLVIIYNNWDDDDYR